MFYFLLGCENGKFSCKNGNSTHSDCIDAILVCDKVCDCENTCEDEKQCDYEGSVALSTSGTPQEPKSKHEIPLLLPFD